MSNHYKRRADSIVPRLRHLATHGQHAGTPVEAEAANLIHALLALCDVDQKRIAELERERDEARHELLLYFNEQIRKCQKYLGLTSCRGCPLGGECGAVVRARELRIAICPATAEHHSAGRKDVE